MWTFSIVSDIKGTTNYNTINNFVQQPLYDVHGSVYATGNLTNYILGGNWKFNNQETLIQNVCNMWYYVSASQYRYWIMEFTKIELITIPGDYVIIGWAFKIVSLILLIIVNGLIYQDATGSNDAF